MLLIKKDYSVICKVDQIQIKKQNDDLFKVVALKNDEVNFVLKGFENEDDVKKYMKQLIQQISSENCFMFD